MSFRNRKNADVLTELEWFFNEAESDIGIRSSWEAIVNRCLFIGGGEGWEDPNTESRLRAVRRHNRMRKAVAQLTDTQTKALFAVHGTVRLHPYVTKQFGKDLAGVAYVLASKKPKGIDDLERICTRVATGKALNPSETLKLSGLRTDAMKFYAKAVEALATNWRDPR